MAPANHRPLWPTLRRLNDALTAVVVVLGLYLILSPFLPRIAYALQTHPVSPDTQVQAKKAVAPQKTPIPADNELKIPRLGMVETIHTGDSVYELNKGVWLLPETSTPDKRSNTVIIGHRFTYAGPAVFYFLDKVQLNDRITVDWQGKEYTYKVSVIKVVPPTELSVEAPTAKPQLTLYTCTPLLTAKDRLVIVAPLVEVRT